MATVNAKKAPDCQEGPLGSFLSKGPSSVQPFLLHAAPGRLPELSARGEPGVNKTRKKPVLLMFSPF
jgi:hypothetical protein